MSEVVLLIKEGYAEEENNGFNANSFLKWL
jgi:hypothetical protein